MQLKHITKVMKRLSIITTICLCYCTRPQIDPTGSTKLTTITEEKNSSSQVIDEVKSNKGLSQAFLSQEGKKLILYTKMDSGGLMLIITTCLCILRRA